MEHFDLALVDWSRAQFALTALYHWIFVPLTLGLSFIVAFMHTLYYKTRDDQWKNATKFWMKLFGINFAIGVATGIILEFEFGLNWSNYSWIVGDIFGAPLAIEGILAFFLESTFIAVMFFGWGRVSKKFHMLSSWFVAFGSNLSALWILIANAWMQNPVGTKFNADTARNEMVNFLDVALSPTAVYKFLHTVSQAYIIGALFVISVSAWFILKNRHLLFAKKSILIATVFGLLASIFVAFTGDSSAYNVAHTQPMKLAAMEGLYDGEKNADLYAFGFLNDRTDNLNFKGIRLPSMLSIMAFRDAEAFVPGVNDIVNGNKEQGILSAETRMGKGRIAIQALADYKEAKDSDNTELAKGKLKIFETNYPHFGYGYFKNKEDIVPNVPLTFYSFHIMVALGLFFIAFFAWLLYASIKDKLVKNKWILRLSVWSILLGYIATELGWIVAEVGRQPWTIQDLLPVGVSTSHLGVGSVQTTFFMFFALFTVLLIAEIKILMAQIKKVQRKEVAMFNTMSYETLQAYWWIIVSLLAALFVFLMFVQGGQTLLSQLSKTDIERSLLVNSIGRKWDLTFTTLVTFGGAFFASFPLFYSTSFGGAYWVWTLILFSFIIQAVSYEYRTKANNFLGRKTYDTFLFINGVLAPVLVGAAVGTFFTGSEFYINKMNITNVADPVISRWLTPTHGLEAALNVTNLSLGLALLFLSRVLAMLYFINNIDNTEIIQRSAKKLKLCSSLFLVFFLLFVGLVLTKEGFAVDPDTKLVFMENFKYLHNLIEMPIVLILFVVGVVGVLYGIFLGAFKTSAKGIWFAGTGTVLTVLAILMLAGFNNTAFYPSTFDLQSSLTIENASSSKYTLTAMSWVSLLVPFVIAYIWYAWKSLSKNKVSEADIENDTMKY